MAGKRTAGEEGSDPTRSGGQNDALMGGICLSLSRWTNFWTWGPDETKRLYVK